MTAAPDAWDECAACGHDRDDRDDHDDGCRWPGCDCPLYTDAP